MESPGRYRVEEKPLQISSSREEEIIKSHYFQTASRFIEALIISGVSVEPEEVIDNAIELTDQLIEKTREKV